MSKTLETTPWELRCNNGVTTLYLARVSLSRNRTHRTLSGYPFSFPVMKPLTRFLWQFAASPRQALRAHCDDLPPTLRVCTATVLLAFGLTALLLFTASCAHTMQGLSREQALYRAGTNVVGQAQSIAPYLPAPVGNTLEIFLALATSALGAWNLHQQAALRQLKNGNGNGNGKAGPGFPQPAVPASASLAQPAGSPLTASP